MSDHLTRSGTAQQLEQFTCASSEGLPLFLRLCGSLQVGCILLALHRAWAKFGSPGQRNHVM